MARIRTIKPEFFTSGDIVALTPLARLFYVSLWCEADKEGRLKWDARTLKMRYLPGDDCQIEDLAGELSESGLIVKYEVEGKQYVEIPSFKDHQVINNREQESVLPARCDDACVTRESGVKAEGRKEGKGREGKERKEGSNSAASPRFDPRQHLIDLGVTPSVADDWLVLRRQKKAAATQTAIDGIRSEAGKAGLSLQEALAFSCQNGWQGFKAEWLGKSPQYKTAAQDRAEVGAKLTGRIQAQPLCIEGEVIRG